MEKQNDIFRGIFLLKLINRAFRMKFQHRFQCNSFSPEIRSFFLSVRRDQETIIWLFVKIFSPSGCSSVFVKCNYENVTEFFCQSSEKEWFKSSWPGSKFGKEVFHQETSLQTVFLGTWLVVCRTCWCFVPKCSASGYDCPNLLNLFKTFWFLLERNFPQIVFLHT